MKFCSECNNMYYLKVSDDDGNVGDVLIYYCRNCGHEDVNVNEETVCVSDLQITRSEQNYTHIVNEYTKYDPTLPRINTIKCPNQECNSNTTTGGGGSNKDEIEIDKYVTQAQESASEAQESAIEAQESAIEAEQNQEKTILHKKDLAEINNREVIYLRYDDIRLKYVYLCGICNTTWKTDNN